MTNNIWEESVILLVLEIGAKIHWFQNTLLIFTLPCLIHYCFKPASLAYISYINCGHLLQLNKVHAGDNEANLLELLCWLEPVNQTKSTVEAKQAIFIIIIDLPILGVNGFNFKITTTNFFKISRKVNLMSYLCPEEKLYLRHPRNSSLVCIIL